MNNIVTDLLSFLDNDFKSVDSSSGSYLPTLPSIETVIAPTGPTFRTAKWSAYQLLNMLSGAQLIPKHIKNAISTADDKKSTIYSNPNTRSTFTRRFIIDKEKFTKFRAVCKKNEVSVTHGLSALEAVLTASLIDGLFRADDDDHHSTSSTKKGSLLLFNPVKLRFLLSVSLRPFASASYLNTVLDYTSTGSDGTKISSSSSALSRDWAKDTIACAAGALDYIISVPSNIPQILTQSSRSSPTQEEDNTDTFNSALDVFWQLARTCSETTDRLINTEKFVAESVRLFGIGMNIPGLDILKAVEVEANSSTSLGRGFSCGVSNAGTASFRTTRIKPSVLPNDSNNKLKDDTDEEISIEEVYFGTSHGRNGVLSLLSCITVNEQLCGCLQFTSPLTSPEEADRLLSALLGVVDQVSE